MQLKEIKILLDKIKTSKIKILVFGDLMLDYYVYGNINRISPEAPVPILDFKKNKKVLGGVGNVLMNLLNLGVHVDISTLIGDDLDGRTILELLENYKVSKELISFSKNINTTKKTRFLSGSNQLLRLDQDSSGFTSQDYQKLTEKVLPYLKNYDCVIISDYNKGVCEKSLIKNIISKANELDIPIFIDPKGSNWSKYTNATCLTPNTKEAENELNSDFKTNFDFEEAAKIFKKKYRLKSCLITRGAEGMTYYGNENIIHQKVGSKKVFDVSGAGDTVIACLAASFCSNISLTKSVELSSLIASEVVSHLGTTPFNMDMIING